MKEHWVELNRVIKKLFPKDDDISKRVKMFFTQVSKQENSGKEALSLIIEGIDNEYEQSCGGKANWEIYLFPDGTWKIV